METARGVASWGAAVAFMLWAYVAIVDRRKRWLAAAACVWMLATGLLYYFMQYHPAQLTPKLLNAWNLTLRLYITFLLVGEGAVLTLRPRECHPDTEEEAC